VHFAGLQRFPFVLLWVLTLDVAVLFIPSFNSFKGIFWAGLIEELTGICCDHLLEYVLGYLLYQAYMTTDHRLG
jgi:hypothetical protein